MVKCSNDAHTISIPTRTIKIRNYTRVIHMRVYLKRFPTIHTAFYRSRNPFGSSFLRVTALGTANNQHEVIVTFSYKNTLPTCPVINPYLRFFCQTACLNICSAFLCAWLKEVFL